MTKIIVESGLVFNLGGYFVESRVKVDFIDIIVGNPLTEDIKIDAPILSKKMLKDLSKKGLILEYVQKEDSLKDKLEEVQKIIVEKLGTIENE